MAQYSARYIKECATITEPLREPTKQDNDRQWGKKEVKGFNAVKAGLAESATTAYSDVKKAIKIVVDARPVGLATLCVQEKRVVVYASRASSDVETHYSQTEREVLAVVWACEHLDKFINGAPQFTVISDLKPLETIWKNRDHHFGSSAGDIVSNHTRWLSSISPVQTTKPTTYPGIQQYRGSCAAVSNTWQSTM